MWTVTATEGGVSVSSSATVVVLETVAAVGSPYVWQSRFARTTAIVIAITTAAIVVPLSARGWFLVSDGPGRADTGLIAALVAVAGTALLATAAFAVLVEVRGRARDGQGSGSAGITTAAVGGDDVAKVIDSLGKLRTVQFLAVAGLLALAIAGLLGWQLSEPTGNAPAGTPTPTPTRTSTRPLRGHPAPARLRNRPDATTSTTVSAVMKESAMADTTGLMAGNTVLVTGGTGGIGKATAAGPRGAAAARL